VTFDPNYWKSFVQGRLLTQMGDRGCLSLFGERPVIHRLFADHLCSEQPIRTTGRGRVVDQWRESGRDNHWWDALVGCAVAASIEGVTLAESGSAAPFRKKRVSFADLRARQSGRPPAPPAV
jgi:hypothetical protein